MKKHLFVSGAAALVVALCASPALSGDAPEKIVIKRCAKKKKPVTFPHGKHVKKNKIACKKCHHKNKPGTACASGSCHPMKAKGKVPGCQEMSIKKNPFHILCLGCHKTDARARKAKAPRTCKDCHK